SEGHKGLWSRAHLKFPTGVHHVFSGRRDGALNSQACHCFNRSTSSSISRRFLSKRAKVRMISAPKAIPAAYHNQPQFRLTEAVPIIVNNDSSRNAVPRNRNARIFSINPANTPITDRTANIIVSQGDSLTPLMKMSEVEET